MLKKSSVFFIVGLLFVTTLMTSSCLMGLPDPFAQRTIVVPKAASSVVVCRSQQCAPARKVHYFCSSSSQASTRDKGYVKLLHCKGPSITKARSRD